MPSYLGLHQLRATPAIGQFQLALEARDFQRFFHVVQRPVDELGDVAGELINSAVVALGGWCLSA
ncbi:hypothetical protein [Hymenobacter convexus]|uniref:hypothetical protein n=1 Tax=Hymenobacter sp. CA1UV-4 TaxID=3063782 RepID=UPI00272BB04E|nr:hypothetical protein [Hymenobacter sp. CA1UV-4]